MRRIARIERERFWSLSFARGGGIDGIIIIVKKKKILLLQIRFLANDMVKTKKKRCSSRR